MRLFDGRPRIGSTDGLGPTNCSINTPSDRGVCSVPVRDPVEREKKRGTVRNA